MTIPLISINFMTKMNHSFNQLLSKKAKNLKRIILILSSISLIMYLMMYFLESMNRYNWLPFGFRYVVVKPVKADTGKVYSLSSPEFKKQIFDKLKNTKKIRSITFRTIIYSHSQQKYRFFFADTSRVSLRCNGVRVKINPELRLRIILLNKGFNEIKIKYFLKKGMSKKFLFFLRFFKKIGVASQRLPFYHYILPESSISKLSFNFVRFLDNTKSMGFLLSLIIILLSLPRTFLRKKKLNILIKKKTNSVLFHF